MGEPLLISTPHCPTSIVGVPIKDLHKPIDDLYTQNQIRIKLKRLNKFSVKYEKGAKAINGECAFK